MIEGMAVLHMSEAELARDIHGVLEKVRHNRPVAVIKAAPTAGRAISDVIAELQARGSHAILDEGLSKDLEAVINSHRDPLNAPAWD
jgi:fructoselysine-6-P-deglycase FrlB-like protein